MATAWSCLPPAPNERLVLRRGSGFESDRRERVESVLDHRLDVDLHEEMGIRETVHD
jgi:hypothetical protein